MASCDPFYFNRITPSVFNTISRELQTKGFAIAGSSGIVKGPYGIVIQYEWDEQGQTLKIEVVEKSFFVSCNQIKEQLHNSLKQYV